MTSNLAPSYMVGLPRPKDHVQHGNYIQHGSYLPPVQHHHHRTVSPTYATVVDDKERYKHVVNCYMNGDQRSALVIDRHTPSPLYRNVLRL